MTEARRTVRFVLVFAAIAACLFTVYTFPYREHGLSEDMFDSYLALYAQAVGAVLSLAEPQISVIHTDIVGRFALRIVKNCDAIEVHILYTAAVLAFPAPLARRLWGLALGHPIVIALNILRICSLYYVGWLAPTRFETFHMEIWPLLLIACTSLLFLGYARWAVPAPGRA